MKLDKFNFSNNYYTNIDRTKIYVDHTNRRVKVIDLKNLSIKNIKRIIYFSSKEHLSKIICNCNRESLDMFKETGFEIEGMIEGYFRGEDAFCMSYFISRDRKYCMNFSEKDSIVKKSLNVKNTFINNINKSQYYIRNANENDIEEMVKLFSTVFSTYPSPVLDKEFLKETMNEKVLYKVAIDNGKIIGIASADMDKENLNAEITDCATYLQYRGKGVLSNIICDLEAELKKKRFVCLYSLSRAIIPGINIALSKQNYKYTGRLINNCNICSNFEDMNIWVKKIN